MIAAQWPRAPRVHGPSGTLSRTKPLDRTGLRLKRWGDRGSLSERDARRQGSQGKGAARVGKAAGFEPGGQATGVELSLDPIGNRSSYWG